MNRHISIWDLDNYFHNSEFEINVECMKISSFYKQKHDIINFITKPEQLTYNYDMLYIAKYNTNTPNPPVEYWNKEKIKCFGTGWDPLWNNYSVPTLIYQLRPDYLLYETFVITNSKWEKTTVVNLLDGNNETLTKFQNPKRNKDLIYCIADRNFWNLDDDKIIYFLQALRTVKNIWFLHKISLKKILTNKLIRNNFLQLKLKYYNFYNDYLTDYTDCDKIFQLREEMPSNRNIIIHFNPLRHEQIKDLVILDLYNTFKIITLGFEKGIYFKLENLDYRKKSPYFILFEILYRWTNSENLYNVSLLEFIAAPLIRKYGKSVNYIYLNPSTWINNDIQEIIRFLKFNPDFAEFTIIKPKGKKLDININLLLSNF